MKFPIFTALSVSSLILLGCEAGKTTEAPTKAPAVTEQPELEVVKTDFERLIAGETLMVSLDACDQFDADTWSGSDDPAGVLVCGTTYEVTYRPDNNIIMTRGMIESTTGGEPTERYNGREWSERTNQFNIWGTRHYMNAQGEVLDKDKNVIGHVTN